MVRRIFWLGINIQKKEKNNIKKTYTKNWNFFSEGFFLCIFLRGFRQLSRVCQWMWNIRWTDIQERKRNLFDTIYGEIIDKQKRTNGKTWRKNSSKNYDSHRRIAFICSRATNAVKVVLAVFLFCEEDSWELTLIWSKRLRIWLHFLLSICSGEKIEIYFDFIVEFFEIFVLWLR